MSLPQEVITEIEGIALQRYPNDHMQTAITVTLRDKLMEELIKGAELYHEWLSQQKSEPVGYGRLGANGLLLPESVWSFMPSGRNGLIPLYTAPSPKVEQETVSKMAEALNKAREHIIWLNDLFGWPETAQQVYGQRNKSVFDTDFYNKTMNIGTLIKSALSEYNKSNQQ